MPRKTTRRDFLKHSGVLATGVWLGTSLRADGQERPGPNARLNVAIIGAGGKGNYNMRQIAPTENIVAFCDVDDVRAAASYRAHPNVPRFTDYRQMFDRQRNIDAVVVSTPDHSHFLPTMMALRAGKHVYCEKPLTHSVWEARQIKEEAARHPRVATSMGNHGTAANGLRTAVEIVRAGTLGDVREVHVWTDRPIWPQALSRPMEVQMPPATLNWDLWLGGAPQRPYHSSYCPWSWRGWWDFGTGAIGDMACHTMNLPFMALRLGAPTSVVAQTRNPVGAESPPEGCTITYEFPARGTLPACSLTWYERGTPPMNLLHGQRPSASGSLLVGSRGTLYSGDDYGSEYRLLPEANFREHQPPAPTLPRSPGHHAEWLRACKGGAAPMANFVDYSCQLTETALLGNVALRVGQRINWDAARGRCTDLPAADRYVRREYRQGWSA